MSAPAGHVQRTVLLLAAALAAAATGLTLFVPGGIALSTALPQSSIAAGLGLAFALSEQLVLRVEFRRQAHTITLSAIPLVIGALIAPIGVVVLARVVGGGTAMVLARMRRDKFVYNITAYAFEAAAVSAAIHAVLASAGDLSLRTAGPVIAAVVLVDQVMSLLILVVIGLHNGPPSRADVVEVLLPTAVVALVTSTAAIGMLLLAQDGALGIVVMVVAAFGAVMLYRGYVITSRRHQALELVHDFVNAGAGAESFAAAAADLLPRVRTLLRAALVEMTVQPADGDQVAVQLRDCEDGFTVTDVAADGMDWPTVRALSQGEPLLASRSSKDRAVQGWLRERGYRDAMLVPLPANGSLAGTVVVADRLGETATFTHDDVTLLQTLTGHLSVASTNARMVERLAYDANHDALTGLANRANLRRMILRSAGDGRGLVMLLDLDRFKEVNDALGHAAGDELLRVVAQRLRATVPAEATVARLGGDEFAVYVPRIDGEVAARSLGQRVSAELGKAVHIEEALLSTGASIGIALGEHVDPSDLLRQADTAMYVAKTEEIGVAVYHADMDRGRVENLALLADLRTTLREHPEQFTVYFQPKIDLRTRAVVSAEALVRWNHPEFGIVPPDRFISLAETSGLMNQFTPVVLEMALREARRWDDLGVPITVAVNMSARNVGDRTLPDRIAAALARTGVPAERLIVEITESSVISEPEQTLGVLNRLAELGMCVSLDDFGTGYSSLSYLQRLPAREVKIDKSFVAGLTSAAPDSSRALISAITSLCTTLGMHVVAEGAETDEVLDELEELGCHVAQGYTIAAPIAAEEFTRWLVQRHAGEKAIRLVRAG